MLAEADMASVFCQILKEQHEGLDLRRASQQGEEKHISAPTDFVKYIITGEITYKEPCCSVSDTVVLLVMCKKIQRSFRVN